MAEQLLVGLVDCLYAPAWALLQFIIIVVIFILLFCYYYLIASCTWEAATSSQGPE